MKTKDIILAFIVLLVLIGAYFITAKKNQVNDVNQSFYKIIDSSFEKKDIVKVQFFIGNKKDSGVIAEKKDGKWVISNRYSYFAKNGSIDKILTALFKSEGELRSDSKDMFREYCIGDDSALHIIIESKSGKKKEILCGKKGPDWGKSFVRLAGEKKVYLANQNLLSVVNIYNYILSAKIKVPDFLNLKIFSENEEDINKVTLFDNEQKLNVYKSGKNWICNFPKGIKLDNEKVKKWLSPLKYVSAKDGADPSKLAEFGLKNSKKYIEIELKKKVSKKVPKKVDKTKVQSGETSKPEFETIQTYETKSVKISFGKKTKEGIYVNISGKREVYILNISDFNKLFIKPEKLKLEVKKAKEPKKSTTDKSKSNK